MKLLARARKMARRNRSLNNFYSGAAARSTHRLSALEARLATRVPAYAHNAGQVSPFVFGPADGPRLRGNSRGAPPTFGGAGGGGGVGGGGGGGGGVGGGAPFVGIREGDIGGAGENFNADREGGRQRPRPDDDDGGRLMTKVETYNMGLKRGEVDPFCTLPRLSLQNVPDTPRGSGAGDGQGAGGAGDDKKKKKAGAGDGTGEGGGSGSGSEGPKFRRNVPPYYKIFELNSRFFKSALGIITLICIVFNIIALITACESDPNIHYRQVVPHIYITVLAVTFIFLFVKYSLYILNCIEINRRMEVAHLVPVLIVLIVLGIYGNWLMSTLSMNYHRAYEVDLGCGAFEESVQQETEALATKSPDEETQNLPLKVWYACGLIRHTYHAGIACIVFSTLLLLGLIANVIHGFMGIQDGIDITS